MNARSLEALAPVLDTTAHWLMTGEGTEVAASPHGVIRAPLVSWVSAGELVAPDVSLQAFDDLPHVTLTDVPEGEWIVLDVDGDSMDRISPPGSRIAVNLRDKRLVANACYIIADESGGATYKRYRPNPDRFEPVSTNQAHEAHYPDSLPRIIGRVRKTMLDM